MQRERIKIYRTESVPDGAGGFTDGEPFLVLSSLAEVTQVKPQRVVKAEQITFQNGVKIKLYAQSGVELKPGDRVFHGSAEYALQGPPIDANYRGRMWELTALSV
jgi:hypothetical protein